MIIESPFYIEAVAEYAENPTLLDAFRAGWSHGHGIACHNVPRIGDSIDRSVDYIGLGSVVDAANVREYHELLCFAAEENSRQFTPFEFTAHAFNSAAGDDTPEELWEAFEAGTAAAIHSDLAAYDAADYGLNP